MMFTKGSPNSHGFVNPRHIEEIWRDQFDWVDRESVSGRLATLRSVGRAGIRTSVVLATLWANGTS